MKLLATVFNWMLVIGLILMLGRIVTAVFMFLEIPFTTFFKDYNTISFIILIIGAIGQQVTKTKKK